MSSRTFLRRKAVLPVTIARGNTLDKEHVHTLDLTDTSAKLGGLVSTLEPGEIIEIQRGVLKAKFQVVWMGASGSPMAGQAGVRSVEPNKRIWGFALGPDETDLTVSAERKRDPMAPARSSSLFPGEKRRNPRYACSAGVSIKTVATIYAIHGEVKDVSLGGTYVELMTPLAVRTRLTLNLTIEGIGLEVGGIVRTSYPLVGMGICFENASAHEREKIALIIEKIQQASGLATSAPPIKPAEVAPIRNATSPLAPIRLGTSPTVLAKACKALADGFESCTRTCSAEEIEQLREAVSMLHEKLLSTDTPAELLDLHRIGRVTRQTNAVT